MRNKTGNNKKVSAISAGFTMIELVVALFLAGVVTSAAMALYITQHKQMIVQDQISDMQASIRASAVELSTKIRLAGYRVPEGVPKIEASNTNPDTITITYDAGGLENVILEHDMPQPSAELRCDGHDISALFDDDWVYIYDPVAHSGEFFHVTQVQYASSHIQHNDMALGRIYTVGARLIRMNQFKYFIDQTDRDHPKLMVQRPGRPAEIFAENITSLNFSYVLSSGAVVDVPPDDDMVREVIISLDGRTDKADDEFAEDYRTRSIDTRVKVRNIGMQ